MHHEEAGDHATELLPNTCRDVAIAHIGAGELVERVEDLGDLVPCSEATLLAYPIAQIFMRGRRTETVLM
jgi:hypothetical protein